MKTPFLFAFCACLALLVSLQARAQEALNPPLTGQMVKMEVFQKPIDIPEIVLASKPTGSVYLSQYQGKLVVLNVWVTWCPPCVAEMPSLDALQKSMDKEKVQVIAVSLEQDMDTVKKFMDEKKLGLTPFIDVNDSMSHLEALRNVMGVPVTLILNKNMQAIARYQGDADWSSQEAKNVIDYFVANAGYQSGSSVTSQIRSLYR